MRLFAVACIRLEDVQPHVLRGYRVELGRKVVADGRAAVDGLPWAAVVLADPKLEPDRAVPAFAQPDAAECSLAAARDGAN